VKIVSLRLLLLSVVFSVGCAAPNTLPEFRQWSRTSSYMKPKTYVVSGLSMETAEERLRSFSNKCMRKQVKSTIGVNSLGYGAAKSTTISTYNPRVIDEGKRVSLVVQREDTNSYGYPKGGVYEFLAEVTPSAKGGVQVFTSNFSLRMPDRILEDVEGWMRGQGQFCPF
jgi:hypothetical protein